MAVFSILVAASLIACTVALMRALNWFGCPTNTQPNALTKKHKAKCERRKVGAYKVAIVGAGKWTAAQLDMYVSMCCRRPYLYDLECEVDIRHLLSYYGLFILSLA